MDLKQFKDAVNSKPDIVIIQLGMNDAKAGNYDGQRFHDDYVKMIKQFQELPTKPQIFLVIPTPLYKDGESKMSQTDNKHIVEAIPNIAAYAGIPSENVIDTFQSFGGYELSKPELFPDFIHSNDEGYKLMAT